MVRASKPFGPTQPPSPHGHERVDRKHAMPFSMSTGAGGTGGSLCVFVSNPFIGLILVLTLTFLLGPQLKKNLERAWKLSKIQGNIASTLTNALDPKLVYKWTAMMDAYYRGSSKRNPFEDPAPSKLPCHTPFSNA